MGLAVASSYRGPWPPSRDGNVYGANQARGSRRLTLTVDVGDHSDTVCAFGRVGAPWPAQGP